MSHPSCLWGWMLSSTRLFVSRRFKEHTAIPGTANPNQRQMKLSYMNTLLLSWAASSTKPQLVV